MNVMTDQKIGLLRLAQQLEIEPPLDCRRLFYVRKKSHHEQKNEQIFI